MSALAWKRPVELAHTVAAQQVSRPSGLEAAGVSVAEGERHRAPIGRHVAHLTEAVIPPAAHRDSSEGKGPGGACGLLGLWRLGFGLCGGFGRLGSAGVRVGGSPLGLWRGRSARGSGWRWERGRLGPLTQPPMPPLLLACAVNDPGQALWRPAGGRVWGSPLSGAQRIPHLLLSVSRCPVRRPYRAGSGQVAPACAGTGGACHLAR